MIRGTVAMVGLILAGAPAPRALSQAPPGATAARIPPVRQGGVTGGDTPTARHAGAMAGGSAHEHASAVPAVSYAELRRTSEELSAVRQATVKYQDARRAEADGYRAIGPDLPGMGTHYVRTGDQQHFSLTEPPILLYERDSGATHGLRLVGVSYLLVAPTDADGQPVAPPFSKALAAWHKHNNVCVLPDNSATIDLSEGQCQARGGRFSAETSWMLHAWIWKDNPTGVFNFTNPLVK